MHYVLIYDYVADYMERRRRPLRNRRLGREVAHPPLADRGWGASKRPALSKIMSKQPIPAEPEFKTPEDVEAYDRWFRTKVQTALESQHPSASHEQVMTTLRKIIKVKQEPDASD